GEPFIEWGGALRWYASQAPAASVREAAAAVGGTACLFRGGDKSVGAFHPLTDAVARLHMRLKREFDPNRIFNPGRLYGDL
ncbi:MAG: glycolate oxidase subunit GlcE, partial [Burkholderiaceae bacterium]|nr:glycolate oxidase subunit GlcE [Burkholderiaceae bacterium]